MDEALDPKKLKAASDRAKRLRDARKKILNRRLKYKEGISSVEESAKKYAHHKASAYSSARAGERKSAIHHHHLAAKHAPSLAVALRHVASAERMLKGGSRRRRHEGVEPSSFKALVETHVKKGK